MEIFSLLASYALLGVFAGVIAGLLGVGGGLVVVPILVALYALQGFAAELTMQLAVGTSLATIVFTSLSSMRAHHRRGAVDWPITAQLSAGIMLGAWLGGVLAQWLGGVLLALLFGLFELAVAVQMGFGRAPAAHRDTPGRARNALAGVVIGALSALLGIGGGTLSVPYLVWHNVGMRRAVGTSSACGLPIALVGALGFVLVGWGLDGLPSGSSGFVYWPAVAAIGVTSVASAPLGARLAHRLDQATLKRVFALFIGLLGIWMIVKNLPAL
ncbi:MAG: sulfite exporter TauE/SafE family protein [Gammaproteobacteria bacterium]|nr:MAG: sulfite exporter TauE/SafE family protein [Gammaproteobacteria bacterium]